MRDLRNERWTASLSGQRLHAAVIGALATLAIPPATLTIVDAVRATGCGTGSAQAPHCKTPGLVGYYSALVRTGSAVTAGR